MEGIYETNESFDFSKLNLISPTNISGGNYFIKFRINDAPLYIQAPKCKTKQGIIKTGKRFFFDLMFTNENEKFIEWMEKLESHCRKIIYENREKWFDIELDEHDIESSFTSPLKLFKSGKYYISRTNVPTTLGFCSLKVYNEDEEEVNIESIEENSDVVTILEIQGIKCSTKNFQIEIELKQMMVLKPKKIFEKCLLNFRTIKSNPSESIISEQNNIDYDVETQDGLKNNHSEQIDIIEPSYDLLSEKTIIDSLDEIHETKETNHLEKNSNIINDDEQLSNNINNNPIIKLDDNEIYEFDFDLDKISNSESVQIKRRNEIYYELYREAKRKAKIARDLAISSYLEAKHIKNTFLLEDSEDSDFDEEEFMKSTKI